MPQLQYERPGKPTSVWIDTTPPTNFPTLATPLQSEVAVVGAGIAGVVTAYLLQKAGKQVVLVEAGRVVHSVTADTTAKVTSAHGLIYSHLKQHFGSDQARLYGQAQQQGLEWIASLVQELAIDCDFSRQSMYVYGQDQNQRLKIQEEVRTAEELGLPVSFVDTAPLPFPTTGAISYTNQAQFHPRKFLLHLIQQFTRSGGIVAEQTRALQFKEGSPSTIMTDKGELRANQVVITTHFPFYDPALYFSRLSPKRSYVLGVQIESPPPQGMFITELEGNYHAIRSQPYQAGHLLIINGEEHKTGQAGDHLAHYAQLEQFIRQNFSVRSIEYSWSTMDYHTLDRVPYIGPISPGSKNTYVATGFGGWGMSNGVVAGLLVSDLIGGRENAWKNLFSPARFKPVASAQKAVSEGVNVAQQYAQKILGKKEPLDTRALQPGQAQVMQYHGKKVAVYKNENGETTIRSAACPHMGCIVKWNNAEKTWDCPCHGSQFDPQGRVMHGPAVSDLPAIETSDQ